jgi:hypothetical protein
MKDLVQTVSLSVILPTFMANYKGNTQACVIIRNAHCYVLIYPISLLYTALSIA